MTATGTPVAPGQRRAPARFGDAQLAGILLILTGVFWLLQRSGLASMSWRTMVSILLVILGAGMVVTARRGSGAWLIALGAAMAIVLVSSSSIDVGVLREGVGEIAASPVTLAEAGRTTSLGIGELNIDLRDLEVPEGTHELQYMMGIGEMSIVLPDDPDIAVRVKAQMQAGEVDMLGRSYSGGDVSEMAQDPAFPRSTRQLVITVTMGLGKAQVERAR